MSKKMGWTALGIIGFIFTPVGLLLALIGAIVWKNKSAAFRHPDEPVIFLAVFGGIGGIFLILGLAFLLADIIRRRRLRSAYFGGNCVDAEITGVVTVNNVNMMNGHPRIVECAYTDASGTVHIYRSRYLYGNVETLLKSKTVPVYIDRNNDNIGFVDIDAVLPGIRIYP